jgi:trk system potassium uptake protein TrkA
VTVLEQDPNRLEQIDYALDARTVEGSASSIMLMQEAGVGDADLFVSLTGHDEVNLIAASTAKGLGAKQTVARIHHSTYIESQILYETILSIDYLLSPEALTALDISRYVESPGVLAAEDFGRGLVQMRQVRVGEQSPLRGKALKQAEVPHGILVGLVTQNGDTLIPHGDTILEAGESVTVVGRREQMDEATALFEGAAHKIEKVSIMGGGSIGLHLAQILESRIPKVKVFESRLDRCKQLAAKLQKASVVCRDATQRANLEQEHVDSADMFIATTADDERNIMASVLAKEVGTRHAVSVVHQPDFAPLLARLGIDHAVTPRAVIANRILRLVHQKDVASLTMLADGTVEVLELPVGDNSPLIGQPLDAQTFPRGALVGTILRGEKVIVPRGGDSIQRGDALVIITKVDTLNTVRKLLS